MQCGALSISVRTSDVHEAATETRKMSAVQQPAPLASSSASVDSADEIIRRVELARQRFREKTSLSPRTFYKNVNLA